MELSYVTNFSTWASAGGRGKGRGGQEGALAPLPGWPK